MVVIETPYDIEILELQGGINGTIIPYGPRHQRSSIERKSRQYATAPAAVASEMAGYMNKRSAGLAAAEAVTGAGDLVADVAAGRQKLSAVKDVDLPDPLKSMSPAQRQAEIEKQLSARKTLNARMNELVKKRDAYVADQRKQAPKPAASFDRVVEETLKAQIRR